MNIPPIKSEYILILILWSLLWKVPALWRSARKGDKFWYTLMVFFSTLGILEYIYLFIISKEEKKQRKPALQKSVRQTKAQGKKRVKKTQKSSK